jgi:hypothetical protein
MNIESYIKKISHCFAVFYQTTVFILHNVNACFKLKNIKMIAVNDTILILPMHNCWMRYVSDIYSTFSDNAPLPNRNKLLFLLCGRKLVFVLYDKVNKKILGTEFYYFNKRDRREFTIHQGFRGILPEFQGKGLGTALTQYAYTVFSKTSLQGMSTRVSCNNLPSLVSNKKIGFEPIEKYFDSEMNEERYYMICHLKNKEI